MLLHLSVRSLVRHPRSRYIQLATFRRSISAASSAKYDRVDVPCRSHGSITVDLFHAAKPLPPILIYLPSGPVIPSSITEEENVISMLRESSGATIARVNYRASSLHPYPTPYHDLLFGFDWIKENLLRDEFNRPYLSRMGVCGELMGGSLATMLALTENRLGESRIAAAAVNNPLVDWVFPDELPVVDLAELPEPNAPDETAFPADADIMAADLPPTTRRRPKRAPKKTPLTSWQRYGDNQTIPAVTLSAERDVLFRKPEDYFDRFASPIHYFRSPHAQLIRPQADDMFASKQPDELIDIETQMDLDHYASVHNLPPVPEVPYLSRCRAYARHYPLVGTQVSLPAWNITTGAESPLFDQGAELVKVLRRSIARHALKARTGRIRWHDAGEKEMYEEMAAEKVQSNNPQSIGLWTEQTNDTWKQNVHEVGSWMKRQLAIGST